MKPIIKRFQNIFLKLYYKNKKDLFLSKSSINNLDNTSDYSFLNHFGKIHYFEKDKVWLATGNDEINYILKNELLFTTSELYKNIDHLDILMGELNDRNKMVRKMIKEIMSEKLFAELEIFIKSESEQLLNNLVEQNHINFQKDYSEKITLEIMCVVFGFRNELTKEILTKHEPQMHDFEYIMQFFDLIYTNNTEFEESKLADRLKKLIAEKIISVEEASIISRIVWVGGIFTSSKLISNLLIGLYEDKNVTSKLENEPQLHIKYIEENLRLSPPNDFLSRFIKTDTTIGKTKLTKGSLVYLDIRLGNRDPKIFESAEQITFEQNKKRHLSFGNGVHQCIGMGLARFEAKLLLPDLFKIYNQFEIEDINYTKEFGVIVFNKISYLKLKKYRNQQ